MKVITSDPYEKYGGKPEFVKELERQNISGFRNLWSFIMNYKDDKDKAIVRTGDEFVD